MRRVGTLTSAITMLALGCLLLADTLLNKSFFVSGLNFWPLIIVSLGLEILFTWMHIRRKKSSETIRLDGRSLALLFLVGVFSVNFYLSTIQTVKGAEDTPTPQDSLFTVKKSDAILPTEDVHLQSDTKQVVIQNPLGNVEVVGTRDKTLHIHGVAHLYGTAGSTSGTDPSTAVLLAPYVTPGATTTIAVHAGNGTGSEQQTAPGTVDLKIEVPDGYDLVIQNDHGDVKLSSYNGNANLVAKSGAITVSHLSGILQMNAQNGPIAVTNTTGNLNITSQQRGVTVNDVYGNVTVQSQAGTCSISRVSGTVDLDVNNGEADLNAIAGDIVDFSNSGPLNVTNAGANVMGTVTNGDIKLTGKVLGNWTLISSNGSVRIGIPKTSNIKFTGVTKVGVIKGPTKSSPSGGGTKPGAYLIDQLGDGAFQVMARSDNGSIIVDTQ